MLEGTVARHAPGSQREIARTEHHGFRHELVLREELCERLIARLEGEASRTPSVPPM